VTKQDPVLDVLCVGRDPRVMFFKLTGLWMPVRLLHILQTVDHWNLSVT